MFQLKKIRLFWWSEPNLMGKTKENYGDLLGSYLVQKISNRNVIWTHPKRWHIMGYFVPIYVTIGSVLAHVNSKCVVWGSGIISKDQTVKSAKFLAVRGPLTRQNLLSQGHDVPKIYGDPALLLSRYYNPIVDKKYSYGIVSHYVDYDNVCKLFSGIDDILIIDLMTTNIEKTTRLFLKCDRILSSSLHGIIVSHAYQIPAVWIEFSDKLFGDGIKFQDYFESLKIPTYKPFRVLSLKDLNQITQDFEIYPSSPKKDRLKIIQDELLAVCPF